MEDPPGHVDLQSTLLFYSGGLPAEELGVWQDVLQPVVVQHAEGEHRRSRVVGKVSGDARWERQHHLPRDLHDTPAAPDAETEGGGNKGLKTRWEGRVHARDGGVTAPHFPPAALGERAACGPKLGRAGIAAKACSLLGMGINAPGDIPGAS